MIKIVDGTPTPKSEAPNGPTGQAPEISGEKLAGWRKSILEAIGISVVPTNESEQVDDIGDDKDKVGILPSTDKVVPMVTPAAKVSQPVVQLLPVVKKMKSKALYYFVALFFVVVAVWVGFFLLRLDRHYPALAARLPWPVAYVKGDILSWRELQATVNSLSRFTIQAGNMPAISQSELEKRALSTWLEARVVDNALARYKLSLKQAAIELEFNSLVQSFGSIAALDEFLQRSYRMGAAEFRNQVLSPLLKRNLLESSLSSDTSALALAEKRAREVRSSLEAGEVDFAEAALTHSDDLATAANGGDLGWFERRSANPDLARALAKLKVGEVSEPVKSELGFHLLKLADVADGEMEPGSENLHVFHILIKPVVIDHWIKNELARFKVIHFLPL